MPHAREIGFLGPEGTFAHLAAVKRFGRHQKLVPCSTVGEVFSFVSKRSNRIGIVPVENSSGGTINETVDRLVIEPGTLFIKESLAINVRLALMARDRNTPIRRIYSHFAPLHHCEAWLNENHPQAEKIAVPSTATAVKTAAAEEGSAAIGNRLAGALYHLKVLHFPIEQEVTNVTQFFVLGHGEKHAPKSTRTTLIVRLPNRPGSLCDLLIPFKESELNLTRILSRPVPGCPNTYVFLLDLDGTPRGAKVSRTLARIKGFCDVFHIAGIYPVQRPYNS